MSNGNTFFASAGLEEALFDGVFQRKSIVSITTGDTHWEGQFISFDSKGRKLTFEIGVNNPFDVVGETEMEVVIHFDDGASRKLPYISFSYQIKQNGDRFIITVEDNTK